MARQLGVIRNVDGLIARAIGFQPILRTFASYLLDEVQQFEQGNRVARASANVVDLAACLVAVLSNGLEGVEQVFNVEDVAHLVTSTEDRQRTSEQCGVKEMRHPPLIFVAKLPLPCNARHAKHGRREIKDASVIVDILVGSAL